MRILPSSYRDRDGFVFQQQGKIYRYIHPGYEQHYQQLMSSGLYDELIKKKMLVPHEEIIDESLFDLPPGRLISPMQIDFISYPYEWSFDMWKDAALISLQIAKASLDKGMLLKDATPFNVQFQDGKPLFIDTISFVEYEEGKPWIAYRQFCECFLAPLLLMHYCGHETNKFFSIFPAGIPLGTLVTLLPKKAKWNIDTYLHIYLQQKLSSGEKHKKNTSHYFSKKKMQVLLNGLENFVSKLNLKKSSSTWDNYYTETISGPAYLEEKTKLVSSFLETISYASVIDLGANDGHFSFLCSNKRVMAIDADANCINELYKKTKHNSSNILPLVIDLMAPSPSIGWSNSERDSITSRLTADLVMALALLHHLAIANNVPMPLIAAWLKEMSEYLLIEFVPKEDDKVQLLLQNREDIFGEYSITGFKAAFEKYFTILQQANIGDTNRQLFLLKRKA